MTPVQIELANMVITGIIELATLYQEINGLNDAECEAKLNILREVRKMHRKRLDGH